MRPDVEGKYTGDAVVYGHAPESSRNVGRLLGEAGFTVTLCQGFSDLLLMAEEAHPCLIVVEETECSLKSTDLQTLRSLSRAAILVLGTGGKPEDTAEALDAGADAYLAGPLSGAEFLARVRSLLRRQQGCPAAGRRARD